MLQFGQAVFQRGEQRGDVAFVIAGAEADAQRGGDGALPCAVPQGFRLFIVARSPGVVTGAGGGSGWIFWDNFPKVSQKRTLSARRAKT